MRKITEKFKNTPRDARSRLVPCSVSASLNREEILDVKSKVRPVINPEGVHSLHTGRSINKKSVNINMVEKVFNFGNLIWRTAIPPLPQGRGLLAEIR